MEKLDGLRAEWRRFEHQDRPAYDRWIASTFGSLLTRLREAEALLQEKKMLIDEIELEVMFGDGGSYYQAFLKVTKRRKNPDTGRDPEDPFDDEDSDFEDPDFDDEDPFGGPLSEEELKGMFEGFVREFLGVDPRKLPPSEYKKMFADFKSAFAGAGQSSGSGPGANAGGRNSQRGEDSRFDPHPKKPHQPEQDQQRIKEIYRILVRRLHPDTRADSDIEVSALWHDVQDAYATGNLERLEMLLALTDIQANAAGDQTTLSQMRGVLAELRRACRALVQSLKEASYDRAWNFSQITDRSSLHAEIRRELQKDINLHEQDIIKLQALLDEWSTPPRPRKKSAKKKKPQPLHPEFFFKDDFPF